MKNRTILLVVALCVSVMVSAEVHKWQATSLAFRTLDDYGYWSEWTDWEDCSILVVFNLNTDRVNIYSNETQEYDIYDYLDESYDNNGSKTVTLKCIDADGLRCTMRLRTQSDGQKQLYVDYSDFMFVYNIEPK